MNKVWIYTISRQLNETELLQLKKEGTAFVSEWTAHENKLTASFEIFKNRIIIVKVNEDTYGASGCSIDKLTRFIKQCEKSSNAELMNRLLVAYNKGGEAEVVHASKLPELLNKGELTENSIVYNTTATNDNELLNWEQPLKNTWLKKYLQKV